MKIAFGIFLLIHGVAHGVGFLTVSGLVTMEDQPTDPTYLLTGFAPEHWLFKVMSGLWLIGLIGFVAAGVGVLSGASWALTVVVAATALSTILSVIWVKAAPFGLVANLIVIAAVAVPWMSDRIFP